MQMFPVPRVMSLPEPFLFQLELPSEKKTKIIERGALLLSFYGVGQAEWIADVLVTEALKAGKWEPIKLHELEKRVGQIWVEIEHLPDGGFLHISPFELYLLRLIANNHVYLVEFDGALWAMPTKDLEDAVRNHNKNHPEWFSSW
jgi:hypothetical protein